MSAQSSNKITVTIEEATKIAGISRTSIYNLFSAGKLTKRKLGGRTLILVSELIQLLESLPSEDVSLRGRSASEAA